MTDSISAITTTTSSLQTRPTNNESEIKVAASTQYKLQDVANAIMCVRSSECSRKETAVYEAELKICEESLGCEEVEKEYNTMRIQFLKQELHELSERENHLANFKGNRSLISMTIADLCELFKNALNQNTGYLRLGSNSKVINWDEGIKDLRNSQNRFVYFIDPRKSSLDIRLAFHNGISLFTLCIWGNNHDNPNGSVSGNAVETLKTDDNCKPKPIQINHFFEKEEETRITQEICRLFKEFAFKNNILPSSLDRLVVSYLW